MTDYAKLAEDALPRSLLGPGWARDLAHALLACDRERQEAVSELEEARSLLVVFERLAGEEIQGAAALSQRYRDALEQAQELLLPISLDDGLQREKAARIMGEALAAEDKEAHLTNP